MAGIEEQFILLAIGWTFIFVRIFVRWRQVGPAAWSLDDYLMPVVGVSRPSCGAPFFPAEATGSFFIPSSARGSLHIIKTFEV